MDLKTAGQRYEEQRKFWAREIADLLQGQTHQSRVQMLRYLAAKERPLTCYEAIPALTFQDGVKADSQYTQTGHVLKMMTDEGLATRRKQDRTYWYGITELGHLVLWYLPQEDTDTPAQAAPARNGRTRKDPTA